MGTIHKITQGGETIFPATVTDAIVHPQTEAPLTDMITEYNVSTLWPTGGTSGGDIYTLPGAISVLDANLNSDEKVLGVKLKFKDTSSTIRAYAYFGNNFLNSDSWREIPEYDNAVELAFLGEDDGTAPIPDFDPVAEISALKSQTTANTEDIEDLQEAYRSLTQSDIVVVESANWPISSGQQVNTIYRVTGTTSYSDYMWNGSAWVKMAEYNNAIDPEPTAGSMNLVESGGVYEELALGTIYDVSAHNDNQTFNSLSDLLTNPNLSTLIPSSIRKGGMSIKFIDSSDHKYVQYRLMATSWSITESDWQGIDDEPTPRSKNLVDSEGVAASLTRIAYNKIVSANTDYTFQYTFKKNHIYLIINNADSGNIGCHVGDILQSVDRIPSKSSRSIIIDNDIYSMTVDSTVTEMNFVIEDLGIKCISLDTLLLESGSINNVGEPVENGKRVRTVNYIDADTKSVIIVQQGFAIHSIYYYNKTTSAFDSLGSTSPSIGIIYKQGCKAKVVFRKKNINEDLTIDEIKPNTTIEYLNDKINTKNPNPIENLKGITVSGVYANLLEGESYYNLNTNNIIKKIKDSNISVGIPEEGTLFKDKKGILLQSKTKWNENIMSVVYSLPSLASFRINKELNNNNYLETLLSNWNWYSEESNNMQNQIYAFFDALMSENSFITKSDAAEVLNMTYPDYANNDIGGEGYKTYIYEFKPRKPDGGQEAVCKKHNALIIGGVHGGERMALFQICVFAYNLCNAVSTGNSNYFDMLNAYNFVFLPCANGYAINHNGRWNGNGVNIERNMNTPNWIDRAATGQTDAQHPFDYDYAGVSAGSEFESRLIANLALNKKPDIVMDLHSYGIGSSQQLYFVCGSYIGCRALYRAASDISYALKKCYPSYFGTKYDIVSGNYGTSLRPHVTGGGVNDYMYNVLGIDLSGVFEVCEGIAYNNGVPVSTDPGNTYRSKDAALIGQYTYEMQFVRMAEQDLMQIYDTDYLITPTPIG